MGHQLPICYLFKTFWHGKIDNKGGEGNASKWNQKENRSDNINIIQIAVKENIKQEKVIILYVDKRYQERMTSLNLYAPRNISLNYINLYVNI